MYVGQHRSVPRFALCGCHEESGRGQVRIGVIDCQSQLAEGTGSSSGEEQAVL